MGDDASTALPVWTLSGGTEDDLPALTLDGPLDDRRLAAMRSVLAAFSSSPLVTLEAEPLPDARDVSQGLHLESVSPLAQELTRLISQTAKDPAVSRVTQSGETLYRMRVPPSVSEQFGQGLLRPMKSKAAGDAIYGDLVSSTGRQTVKAKASFVPVDVSGGAQATSTSASRTARTAAIAAGPFILLAVSSAASAYAEEQRRQAIENITSLLEKLHTDNLESERSELEGCRDAIDKATALLLDRGKVGASLGLDSAVHAISTATQRAESRVTRWRRAIDAILEDGHVDLAELEDAFPGLTSGHGEFRAQVELAALAIALKRRVVVLQGVEAAQGDPGNELTRFMKSLQRDQQRIDALDDQIGDVLLRLSNLQIHSPKRLVDKMMTRGQVDRMLDASYRLRELAPARHDGASDVVIEIAQHRDGALTVLPSMAT